MTPPADWAHLPFFNREWPAIRAHLGKHPDWLPGPDKVFAALTLPPRDVRVVILGQDPYPTPGHANGLAFSVAADVALPRSLRNIFTEMQADIGAAPADGDLTHLRDQGVLLLNSALSVPAGHAGGHGKLGWEKLAAQVIGEVQQHRPVAFLLWGMHAQKTVGNSPRPDTDLVISTAHPSPLSARRGFFGSRPFSQINAWLAAGGQPMIDWVNR